MAFPDDPAGVSFEAAFGADRGASPDTWSWDDIGGLWLASAPLTLRRGRRENAGRAEASELTATFRNPNHELSFDDPRSPYWPHVDEGVPLRARLDPGGGAAPVPFDGFIAKLAPQLAGGSNRVPRVTITAGGLFRALGRGTVPPRDALFRWLTRSTNSTLTDYWPMAHGDELTLNQVAGGASLRKLDQTHLPGGFGEGRLAPWLDGGLLLGRAGETGAVEATTRGTQNQCTVDVMMAGNSITETLYFGVYETIIAQSGSSDLVLTVIDTSTSTVVFGPSTFSDGGLRDGGLHHLRVEVIPTGSDTAYIVFTDTGQIFFDVATGVTTTPLHRVAIGAQDTVFGHLAFHDGSINPAISFNVAAAFGHVGEAAGVRAARIAAERNAAQQPISLDVIGDPAETELMGRQPVGTQLDLLRDCELADDAILSEAGFGASFRTRLSRYSQTPAVVIDAAARELGKHWTPVRDDQRLRNKWTIRQPDPGNEVTVSDEEDQAKRGPKPDSLTANLAHLPRVTDRGEHELHRSTRHVLRYPQLVIPLHSGPPELAAAVAAARLGDRIQVDSPPDGNTTPSPINQVIEGDTHILNGRRKWVWSAVVGPWEPWQAGMAYGSVFVAASTAGGLTGTEPDDVLPGDRLIAVTTNDSNNTLTPPAGWTQLGATVGGGTFNTVAQLWTLLRGEAAPDLTWSGTADSPRINIFAFRHADRVVDVDGASATATAPSVDADRLGQTLLAIYADSSWDATGVPAGMTRVDVAGEDEIRAATAYVGTGATGTRVFTGSDPAGTFAVVLAPRDPLPYDPIRRAPTGAVTVGAFDTTTDTALTVDTPAPGWTTDSEDVSAELAMDVRAGGVTLRVTAIADDTGTQQVMTVAAADIAMVIPSGSPVVLAYPASYAH